MIGIVDADSILYRACWDASDLQEAQEKYLDIIKIYLEEGWCDNSISFVKGKGNWRYNIFEDYKAHRGNYVNTRMNMEVMSSLIEWLRKERLAIGSDGMEADDLVRRKAEKCSDREQNFVIISADKDLDCIAGKHIRPNNKGDIKEYTVTQEEADYHYYYQVLLGDTTDNIKSPKGLGAKTAKTILDTNSKGNWKKAIEKEYKERCGSEWFHALMFTGSLIHIQRFANDYFVWDLDKGNFWECGFSGAPKCYDYKPIKNDNTIR